MSDKEIKFDIRYTGGSASNNKLDLYDASNSILGFSRALAITSHALITGGDLRVRGSSVPNVKTYLHPPKKGSFIETVSIVFQEPAVIALGTSVVVSAFWAMLEYSWKIATGQEHTPTNHTVNKIIRDNDLLDVELINFLETPLQQIHRPILAHNDMKIQINRPRKGKIIEFDFLTKEYVHSSVNAGIQEDIKGNVTKYNILTGYGRVFVDELEKTIPFNIDKSKLSVNEEEIIKWSLYKASNLNYSAGKILFSAEIIKDKQDKIKRYTIVQANNIIQNEDNEDVI